MRTKERLACTVLAALMLCGCSASQTPPSGQGAGYVIAESAWGAEPVTDADTAAGFDFSFSERDRQEDYGAGAPRIDLASFTSGAGATLKDGVLSIRKAGTYVLTGSLAGWIRVDVGKEEKVRLVLDNAHVQSAAGPALYIAGGDKVFLTLAPNSENTLADAAAYAFPDDADADAAVFSRADLSVGGTGSLTLTGNCAHGVVSRDDLILCDGTLRVDAKEDGLVGKDCVKIADATLAVNAGGVGIRATNLTDAGRGFVYLQSGALQIAAGSAGLRATSALYIDGGSVEIRQCSEGLEGATVTVRAGTLAINAADDGINAAGGDDTAATFAQTTAPAGVYIYGGTIRIAAEGDGVDANGCICMQGGTLLVSGPSHGADKALDYDTYAYISGGTVVAAGGHSAQTFGAASAQPSILTRAQGEGERLTLLDEAGNVLLSWTPDKKYESVVLSCPALRVGERYALLSGGELAAGGNGSADANGFADASGFADAGTLTGGERLREIALNTVAYNDLIASPFGDRGQSSGQKDGQKDGQQDAQPDVLPTPPADAPAAPPDALEPPADIKVETPAPHA